MAKVGGPLMSVEAHGSVSKTLTFQTTKAGQIVKGYKKPKDPRTEAQKKNRSNFKLARDRYKELFKNDRLAWRFRAYGEKYTGYAAFMKYCKTAYDQEKTWVTIQDVRTIEVSNNNARIVGTVTYDVGVKVMYGEVPGRYYKSEQEYPPYEYEFEIGLTGLEPLTKYYYRVDLITEDGYRGETGDYVFTTTDTP